MICGRLTYLAFVAHRQCLCLSLCRNRLELNNNDGGFVLFYVDMYHGGKNPTRFSPPCTSLIPSSSKGYMLTPSPGVRVTRHTHGEDVGVGAVCADGACSDIRARSEARNSSPQRRQICGSHALGFPRTRRGICMVLNDWVVVIRPAGVRKPTMISCERTE